MNINIKYFGLIAEITEMEEQTLDFEDKIPVSELIEIHENQFPKLMSVSYKIAVNQNLVDLTTEINQGDEVAFLPPFAGG